jgi:hypothetical protein
MACRSEALDYYIMTLNSGLAIQARNGVSKEQGAVVD